MSEPKKYYWLKLKEDFFDDDTISYIEEQENGVVYVNFYLKLCLKSLKAEGKLIRLVGENFIPYDVASLSRLTRTPADTVRVAMSLFEKIGLIKILETGEIYLSQINELIGKETDKAAIMRRKRAEEKILSNNVTPVLPECYPEIEIEKEKDTEIETDTEFNSECDSSSDSSVDFNADNGIKADAFYQRVKDNRQVLMHGVDIAYAFDMLYKQYPKHAGKKEAATAFLKLVRKDTRENIIDLAINIDTYRKYVGDNGTEDRYIKMFSGFIRDTQYNEYPQYNCKVMRNKKHYETRDEYMEAVRNGEISLYCLPQSSIMF